MKTMKIESARHRRRLQIFKLWPAKPAQIDANPFDFVGPGYKDQVLNTENSELYHFNSSQGVACYAHNEILNSSYTKTTMTQRKKFIDIPNKFKSVDNTYCNLSANQIASWNYPNKYGCQNMV